MPLMHGCMDVLSVYIFLIQNVFISCSIIKMYVQTKIDLHIVGKELTYIQNCTSKFIAQIF